MSLVLELSAAKPPDLELVATGGASPTGAYSEPTGAAALDLGEGSSPGAVSSVYEQNAVAALLGLQTASFEASSPDDDGSREDDMAPTGADWGSRGRWGDLDTKRWPHLSGHGYNSPAGESSPKLMRRMDYETPGQGSPKRQRNPKDGASARPRRLSPPSRSLGARRNPPAPRTNVLRDALRAAACADASAHPRARAHPCLAGAPPPGTTRFRCRFPGCKKLYASTDAVRKHCRKRHLEWLRRIDMVSAHDRGMPKPALYCVWGAEEEDL